jgi:heat-inducible transcriptional repressor
LSEVKNSSGVQVFVGADCPLEVAKDCAMVTASYGTTDHRLIGTVGVIGPMRMNYEQAVAVVDYTAKVLSKTLQQQLNHDPR